MQIRASIRLNGQGFDWQEVSRCLELVPWVVRGANRELVKKPDISANYLCHNISLHDDTDLPRSLKQIAQEIHSRQSGFEELYAQGIRFDVLVALKLDSNATWYLPHSMLLCFSSAGVAVGFDIYFPDFHTYGSAANVPPSLVDSSPEGTVWFGGPVDSIRLELLFNGTLPSQQLVAALDPDTRLVFHGSTASTLQSEVADINDFCKSFFERLSQDLNIWHEIALGGALLSCKMHMREPNRGIEISSRTLSLLSKRHLPLQFAVSY